ncbi:hypothetical protein ISN45_Aa07g032870 [Arabidopsis thaliana x Arabidopsis arenosa]|uniref:DUF1985 domain-containing protein n=1 Tax=Arabidopsis thaliana x Arabidopsis arenosa TaxID=1240361 RepID=A0A8T1YC30_9BRAS|nr:hypothetical protein ISN45_Aa07g032870 [Arabidopsis thaliana x Arabidopsis arenosa]
MRTKNPSYREEPNPTDVMVEAQETRGDEPEETESNPPSNPQDSTELEEEIEAMQPLNMYFGPEEYIKPFKISAKCYIAQTVRLLGTLLKPDELDWFLLHPQFKHFFHMPKNSNHKLMGMWMLLLRTTCLEKKKECWFIVNGVPIRYSLREMALMSGLNCREYPPFMEGLGSLESARKYFGVGATVTYAKVKAKLLSMKEPGTDRLKMAVLFFLSSIIIGKKNGGKQAPSVEPFFLRVVDDLEECKTFPWGHLAFDENMKDIFHLMNHFDGVVGAPWVFPSFVIPLEFLAFEAIPVLKNTFREDVSNVRAYHRCPRMCRMKYKPSKMKGFSLTEIYDCLGTTKIHSILPPSSRETHLLGRIMEADNGWNDADYPIADGWSKRLIDQEKSILFEDLYNQDVATRGIEVGDVELDNVDPDDVATDDVEHDNVDPDDMEHDNVDQDDVTPNNLLELGDMFIQLEDRMNKGFKEIMRRLMAWMAEKRRLKGRRKRLRGNKLRKRRLKGRWRRLRGNKLIWKRLREKEKAEREQAEKEKAEKENAERGNAEKEKADNAEKEKAEKEMAEKEKAEKEKAEKEKVEAEKEKAEKERVEKEKAEKEKAEKEKAEKELAEKEMAEKELAEKELAEKEKAEKERVEKEKAEKEKAEKELAEKEKAEKERVEKEKAEKEKAEKEMAEKEKAEAEKAVAEKVEAEKVEGEKEKAVNDQEEKVEGERQISIQYERKSRKRNAEVQGEEEVAGEAQQNKKMKIIGKKGKKGSTVVIRSPIMTRQKKEQKKD